MNIKRVGQRGILFTFFELKNLDYDCVTNIYVINGNRYFFICDTYLGPSYIKEIKKYLEDNFGKKQYIVFNSHSHWDHIWGNSEFKDFQIISHELCEKYILKYGQEDLIKHEKQFAKDKIEIVLPNTIFKEEIEFKEEGVKFFYTPGHSDDSSSCYDYKDKILFVGDNIDDPIPSFMCWSELDKYKETLERYLQINADIVIQSHGHITNKDLIKDNISYINKLIRKEKIDLGNKEMLKKHLINMEYLRSVNEE
ncbi:MBL fold metallo-hydrolase [Inediibacterium massiliense]|uniref:MBL fold metallo-hydrolase n=1 Tax=Inediibacterium massiliense TaxID=1658111 RepID=UPI000DA621F8|nr:MBL fold metallo-hydrolase [Inediibacterium massiliense]